VEDDVAKAVAREIRVRLTSKTASRVGPVAPVNPEAFDAYMQGYYSLSGTQTKIRTWLQSITNGRLSLIPPMLWLGRVVSGTQVAGQHRSNSPLRRVTGLRVKRWSEL